MPVIFSFDTDEDTKRLLEIAVFFLERYFGHDEEEAISLVNRYYEKRETLHDDDYYHHVGSFEVAVQAHYFVYLEKNAGYFPQWKLVHNLINSPKEAQEYFRERYFKS